MQYQCISVVHGGGFFIGRDDSVCSCAIILLDILSQDQLERKIEWFGTINTDGYGANTCVCIAYKVFQIEVHDIPFDLSGISFV